MEKEFSRTENAKNVEKQLGGQISDTPAARMLIDLYNMCDIPERGYGLKGEHEVAYYIEKEMKKIGLSSELQPFKAYPYFSNIYIIHIALCLLSFFLYPFFPVFCMILAVVNVITYYLDVHGKVYTLRHLFPQRKSYNVLTKIPASGEAKKRVYIGSHHDAPRITSLFNPKVANLTSTLFQKLNRTPPVFGIPALLMVLLLICNVLPGIFPSGIFPSLGSVISIISYVSVVLLILLFYPMVSNTMSPINQGANDNGSSVTMLLELARHFKKNPLKNTDITLLSTGMEEAVLTGKKMFMKMNKNNIPKENTYFVTLECVGGGNIYIPSSEWTVKKVPLSEKLRKVAHKVYDQYERDGKVGFKPHVNRSMTLHSPTDALIPGELGYETILFIGFNDYWIPTNYHQVSDIPENIDPKVLGNCQSYLRDFFTRVDEDL